MKFKHLFITIKASLCYSFLLSITMLSCTKNNDGAAFTTPTPITPVIVVPPVTPTPNAVFAKGADVSWLTEMEANGIKFYNSAGIQKDGMALLQSLGINTIRLRVWVNPSNNYNASADVVAKAVRAKNLGLRIMIDFHYSDTWADPGQQTTPAAWASQDINGLKISVTNHTTAVLTALNSNGVTPEWVQIGNETNNGMLWPLGKASTNMANFAALVNAGYDASKAVFPNAKVIVQVSNGFDNGLFKWLFDGLKNNGGKYDVIGMSLYPTASNWATYNSQCLVNMNDMVARYGKEVMVVEVGMSWDSATDSKSFISDLITKTKTVTNGKGIGVLYWEPLAYNGWKGYTLGAFDNTGKPTIAMDAFQ
jgi:arabinogalactan endo-1,4-beta-galactosidase